MNQNKEQVAAGAKGMTRRCLECRARRCASCFRSCEIRLALSASVRWKARLCSFTYSRALAMRGLEEQPMQVFGGQFKSLALRQSSSLTASAAVPGVASKLCREFSWQQWGWHHAIVRCGHARNERLLHPAGKYWDKADTPWS